MPSIWTDFIKQFSAKHNLKYACALSKYKEPLKKAYKLFKEKKEWYEPLTNEISVGGQIIGGNKWTDFIKEYAKKNNTTYGCALSDIAIKNAYKLFKDGKEWYFPKVSVEIQTDDFIEPKPVKAPENIEPVVNKIEEKIKQLEKLGSKHGAVSYDATGIIADIAYVNLLKKYGGDCIVVNIMQGSGINKGIIVNSNPKISMIDADHIIERLGKTLKKCIDRGVKLILIPLSLQFNKSTSGHANMLVYRPFKRLVERFEPHGYTYGNSIKDNTSFNTQLKTLWEKNLTPYIGEVRFRDPSEICPNPKGFQSLEGQLQGLSKEGGGFCSMWSLFLAEMTFINPDKSTKEIIQEVLDITNKEPAYLKSLIRGYVLEVEKELDNLLKILSKSSFKFGKESYKIILDNKKALENWILNVVFDSDKYSQAPPQFEPLPDTEIKTKSDEEKLKETYYNKINKLKKQDFINIFDLYGLRLPPSLKAVDIPYFFIKNLYDKSFEKYGASGLKDIDIILEEELHKKKGAYEIGLSRSGYFINKEPKPELKQEQKQEPKQESKTKPKQESNTISKNKNLLIDNWEDANLAILFSQLLPTEYSQMEKKINDLVKKNHIVILGDIAYFIRDIIDDLFIKLGTNKDAASKILLGLADITKYINEDADYSGEDYTRLYKYLSSQNKIKLQKYLNK